MNEADELFLKNLNRFRDEPLTYQAKKRECTEILNNLKIEMINIIAQNKKWLTIKIDNFYNSVEETLNPSLKSSPYLISIDNIIKSTSPNLPKSIVPLMDVKDAKKIYPSLIEIKFHPAKYANEVKKITKILLSYDKHLERVNYDEYILDITDFCKNNFAGSKAEYIDISNEILSKIKEECKFESFCGFGNNKVISKIACAYLSNKKDKSTQRIVYIDNDISTINLFLSNINIALLNQFLFEKTLHNLSLLDVKTISDIFAKSVEIYFLFPSQYMTIFSIANGIGNCSHENIKESKPLFFQANVTPNSNVFETVEHLSKKIANEMLKENMTGKTITIEVNDKDNKKISKSLSLIKRFESEVEIANNAKNLVKMIIQSNIHFDVKAIKLKLSGLIQSKENGKENKLISRSKKGIETFFEAKKENKSVSCSKIQTQSALNSISNNITQEIKNNDTSKRSNSIVESKQKGNAKQRGRKKTQSVSKLSFKTLDTFIMNK